MTGRWLWHPESPGVRIFVKRTWVGWLIGSRHFATNKECRKAYENRAML